MIELLRTYAPSIALLTVLGGLVLVNLTASQPLLAHQRQLVAGEAGGLAVDIGGRLDGPLRPGVTRYLDLTFRNPSTRTVLITSVTVSLVTVAAREPEAHRPCPPTDFVVDSATLPPLAVGAGEVVRLSDSGVPRTAWPSVRMLDTAVNQDGCRGSVLTLDYRAAGEVR